MFGGPQTTKPLAEDWCYRVLRQVRWPEGTTCPFCGERHVTSHSKFVTTPRRRYLCLECRRTFSDLTGTPLARTNLTITTWFDCLRRLDGRPSTAELARELGVKWDTADQLRRRLSAALRRPGLVQRLHEAVVREGHA